MTKPPWLPTWLPMANGMSSQRGAQPVAIERSAKLTPELYDLPLEKQKHGFWPLKWVWVNTHKYITIVGWTSIYQLFWGSLGTRVLTHPQVWKTRLIYQSRKKHACWFRIHDVHDGNPLVAGLDKHGPKLTIRDYAKDCQWQEEWEFRNVIVWTGKESQFGCIGIFKVSSPSFQLDSNGSSWLFCLSVACGFVFDTCPVHSCYHNFLMPTW